MKKKLAIFLGLMLSCIQAEEPSTNDTTWGVEINPIRVLLLGSDYKTFSGTLSHFDNDHGIEISLPLFYEQYTEEYEDKVAYHSNKNTTLNIDLHYRRYFTMKQTEGLYLGTFGRYTYLHGQAYEDTEQITVNKLGFGTEIGFKYKHIFNTSLYVGASLMIGAYVLGQNDQIASFDFALDDSPFILDLELLKIGYEF